MSVGPITPPSGGTAVQPVGPGAVTASAPDAAGQPYATGTGAQPTQGQGAVSAMSPAEAALALLGPEALAAQDSLAPLLADLAAALQPGAEPEVLPPDARALAQRILAAQTPLGAEVDAGALKAAVQSSGLFLEAGIAAALRAPGSALPPAYDQDLKALLTRFVAELDPGIEAQASQTAPRPSAHRDGPGRPPPPARGAPTSGEGAARPSAEVRGEAGQARARLRQDAESALARLALTQAASMPSRTTSAAWRFDLPVETPAGPGVGQFEINRDGARSGEGEPEPTWRARFSLDVEPGGPVHAEISLSGGRTRVTLWAERDGVLRDLESGRLDLVAALAGPDGADAAVRVLPGAPPPPAAPGRSGPPPGQLLDRTS